MRKRADLENARNDVTRSRSEQHAGQPMCVTTQKPKKKKSPSQIRRDKARMETWKLQRSLELENQLARQAQVELDSLEHASDLQSPDERHPDVDVIAPDSARIISSGSPVVSVEILPVYSASGTSVVEHPTHVSDDVSDDCLPMAKCFVCETPESDTVTIRSCSGCKVTKYCSRDCQIHHWKAGHKDDCATVTVQCK